MASKDDDRFDDNNNLTNKEDIKSLLFKGTHEVLECLEGQEEVDLQTHLANCQKNPGHSGFIPIVGLTPEHFPSGCHNINMYDITKAVADLTVRVAVQFSSLDRPEYISGTKDSYPCYNTRGKNSLRTGTGRVLDVIKCTEGIDGYTTCPCPECKRSDTPKKVWWNISVVTARHVVFDSAEASHSRCRLWYDDDKSPVVNIFGWNVSVSNTEDDVCSLNCATHELEVGDKLNEMARHFDDQCKKVSYRYKHLNDMDKLTVIVSHPHGCCKQVSIGHWVHKQKLWGGWSRYTYTTCTCPGSSGALVYRLGCDWSTHPHSGANSQGLNYSGVW